MTDEIRAILDYEYLVKKGYHIKRNAYDSWTVIEPENRNFPQSSIAFNNMAEIVAWARGVEAVRKALGV